MTENTGQIQSSFDIREVFPYLSAFRGQTFVVVAPVGMLLDDRSKLIEDLVLLSLSGIRLVLVPDYAQVLGEFFKLSGLVTDGQPEYLELPEESWENVSEALASRHFQVQAMLTRSVHRQEISRQYVQIHSGSYIRARGRGIHSGKDLGHNGTLRSVEKNLLANHLDMDGMVLLPPLASSSSGTVYWMDADEMACEVSVCIESLKLLMIEKTDWHLHIPSSMFSQLKDKVDIVDEPEKESQGRTDEYCVSLKSEISQQLLGDLLRDLLDSLQSASRDTRGSHIYRRLAFAHKAIANGVERVHLVCNDMETQRDGLLLELFTHHGFGTMVSARPLESIRDATIHDVGAITSLIAPLEQDGTLTSRSRDQIEAELQFFLVVHHDNRVIGCASLIPIAAVDGTSTSSAELSCLSIADDYRKIGVGERLLRAITARAEAQRINCIYVLTTRTHEWFAEHGFEQVNSEFLPEARLRKYDMNRRSIVMRLQLTQ